MSVAVLKPLVIQWGKTQWSQRLCKVSDETVPNCDQSAVRLLPLHEVDWCRPPRQQVGLATERWPSASLGPLALATKESDFPPRMFIDVEGAHSQFCLASHPGLQRGRGVEARRHAPCSGRSPHDMCVCMWERLPLFLVTCHGQVLFLHFISADVC